VCNGEGNIGGRFSCLFFVVYAGGDYLYPLLSKFCFKFFKAD